MRRRRVERFGLITHEFVAPNVQPKVVAAQLEAKNPLSIIFAIPDHPWYLGGDMAAVRIAMTVESRANKKGNSSVLSIRVASLTRWRRIAAALSGLILPNLTIGVDT